MNCGACWSARVRPTPWKSQKGRTYSFTNHVMTPKRPPELRNGSGSCSTRIGADSGVTRTPRTAGPVMAKSYQVENCPVARTLDVIGERWTLLLLRDLLRHGPRRFQDFQISLPGVAPNTLSARLKSMEDNGLVVARLQNRWRCATTAKILVGV